MAAWYMCNSQAIFSSALNSKVHNQRQPIRLIFCNIFYILSADTLTNCWCAPVSTLTAKQDITYKILPEELDTQKSSSFKKEEKFAKRKC